MFYIGTRSPKDTRNFLDCLINVIPSNGGLFVPSFISKFDYKTIESFATKGYHHILTAILLQFCEGFLQESEILEITKQAYKNFSLHEDFSLLSDIDENTKVLDLTSGPTMCSKDYGMNLAASIIDYICIKANKKVAVVDVSTSGFSACSTLAATHNKESIKSFIIYLKEHTDNLVKYFSCKYSTDKTRWAIIDSDHNCVNNLKFEIYNNTSFREEMNLTFINELNLFNILSYTALCFYCYLGVNSKPFAVSIASGNCGMALGVFIAKQMGLPIKKIILGLEKNSFFNNFQKNSKLTKERLPDQIYSCLNVSIPSNLDRLLYYLYGANQDSVKRIMSELYVNNSYKVNENIVNKFNQDFFSVSIDNEFEIRNNIYSFIKERDIFIEQTLSIALLAADRAKAILSDIKNLPMVVFKSTDFSRSLDFVNQSIGYDIEPKIKFTAEDINSFNPIAISENTSDIGNFIINNK
jgi:threonine synthase